MNRKYYLTVTTLIIIFMVTSATLAAFAARHVNSKKSPSKILSYEKQKAGACCGYWAVIIIRKSGTSGQTGSGLYDGSNVFMSEVCHSQDDHVKKYVDSIIGKQDPNYFNMICEDTRQKAEVKSKPPASYRIGKQWYIPDDPLFSKNSSNTSQNSKGASNTPSSNKVASSNTKNQTSPGASNKTTEVVRKPGESEEDFLTRQKAAAFAAYQKQIGGLFGDSSWTDEDGKKYTQGKKGHWETKSFRATAWCADKMFMATGYVDACVVDEKSSGAFKGTSLQIRNSSPTYPVYYGLSGVFNKMVGPGEAVIENLHMYQPIDPVKKAKEPDTVVDIMVKYWVEDR